MTIFLDAKEWLLRCSRHRSAPVYLALLSLTEAIFFPIPTDAMLIPMVLAQTKRALFFAFVAALFSVVGSIIAYMLGLLAFSWIEPWLHNLGYESSYQKAALWFSHYGLWCILIAGFTPLPYKLFTLAAGSLGLSFPLFLLGAVVGRSMRYALVALVVARLGESGWRQFWLWAMVAIVLLASLLLYSLSPSA